MKCYQSSLVRRHLPWEFRKPSFKNLLIWVPFERCIYWQKWGCHDLCIMHYAARGTFFLYYMWKNSTTIYTVRKKALREPCTTYSNLGQLVNLISSRSRRFYYTCSIYIGQEKIVLPKNSPLMCTLFYGLNTEAFLCSLSWDIQAVR